MWPIRSLGDVAETRLGKMLDTSKPRGRPMVKYLRNVNVQWGRIDTHDLLSMEISDSERERFGVKTGDLLVCEGGEVGRCAIWQGRTEYLAFQKALHRIRPSGDLDVRFLRYLMEHYASNGTLSRLSTGSTIAHLPQQQLRRIPVPLPTRHEQLRVVEILEDHLSRLETADIALQNNRRRIELLHDRLIRMALVGETVLGPRHQTTLSDVGTADGEVSSLPSGWRWSRLGEEAEVVGGVTKDAKKQTDPNLPEVPYLRVANVQRGLLHLDSVSTIRVPATKASALRLEPGDVLMNEGGDRDKLARGWVWEGQIADCIHQNHVFRARVKNGLDPYFLSWTTNILGGRWAERNGKQSVNLASISLSTIRKMPVIVPPQGVSQQITRDIRVWTEDADRILSQVRSTSTRSGSLRTAILKAAFEGRLSGRSRDDQVIGELAGV